MEILEEDTQERYVPHVLELSFGVDRNVYSLLDIAYHEDSERGNTVLSLSPRVAPFVCGVFPLVKNKDEIAGKAREVYELVRRHVRSFYDESGTVGRRYARADEIGVPYCITIDFDTLVDGAVTIRDRDTTKQERVPISDIVHKLVLLAR